MAKQEIREDSNYEIKADKVYAQILLVVNNHSPTLEDAKRIIEDLGVRIIETKRLSLNNCALLKLDVKDMRDVALKLTERGFVIKGINALLGE